jgi:dynein light chain LC8-type
MAPVAEDVQAATGTGAAQKDTYACKEQHYHKVIDSLMPQAIENNAVLIALAAVDRHKQIKDIAEFTKREMDKNHPGSGKATEGVYHCVVGKSFASECCLLMPASP